MPRTRRTDKGAASWIEYEYGNHLNHFRSLPSGNRSAVFILNDDDGDDFSLHFSLLFVPAQPRSSTSPTPHHFPASPTERDDLTPWAPAPLPFVGFLSEKAEEEEGKGSQKVGTMFALNNPDHFAHGRVRPPLLRCLEYRIPILLPAPFRQSHVRNFSPGSPQGFGKKK